MAGELVSFGIQKLWDLLSHECELFQGVEGQVAELKGDLSLLTSFLKDADAKKHTSAAVKNCVEQIKDIIFDGEDIIETFLQKQKLGKTSGIKKRIRRLTFIIPDRRELALDIASIRTNISNVIRNMKSLGVVQQIITNGGCMQPQGDRQKEIRQTFPTQYESDDFVALEENVKKLVGYFVEDDNVQVVSITGMGGLGKTTLAKQVFNHEDVKRQFDGFAWVCVSQDFTRNNLWQKILSDLKPKEEEKKILEMTESTLQGELYRFLETSKSLIVLDDIWKKEDWELIKPIFPLTKGWKVLLTSRNESIVAHRNTSYINLRPEYLTIEDSWKLFQRIAFPEEDASEFNVEEEMEKLGKQMIKHCGGLPLAIKVLGGMLAEKYTPHDWRRLSENIGSHLVEGRTDFNEDNNNSCNYVLSMSFEELPSYLKHCFLYLAHFPEDHTIGVEKLYYYWAAEGVFRPSRYNGESIRDVGDVYIEELVRRNMVISVREATTLRFGTCHLHDMMREICLLKAKEENFLQITSSGPPTANCQSTVKARRFVSHNPTTLHVGRDINNPKLRSLVVVQDYERDQWKLLGSSYTSLELLRVLDLSRAKLSGMKLDRGIGKLIHLRYLSLEGATVSHIPSSLGNLKLLIYLNLNLDIDIWESAFVPVPNVLMGMQELRYLALPKKMGRKTKLELSNLVKLETLENFSTKNSRLEDLRGMVRLRTLTIKIIEETSLETLSASIGGMKHLEDLTIEDQGADRRTKEEGIVLDFVHLKKLELRMYMPRLFKEQHFPSHLTSLSLASCRLEEDPMLILEKLVQLKELVLEKKSFSERRMVCSSGGFPQLQTLVIDDLEEWEEWIVEEGSMPLLHFLRISGCPKFKKLHACGFPQLQKLVLYHLEEWEEWKVEEGSMLLLHSLVIWWCPKLKELLSRGFPQSQELDLRSLDEWEEWIIEEGSMPLLHSLDICWCPKLKKLHFRGCPKLHTLKLCGSDEWEEWVVEEGSMPLLHSLTIHWCPKLKKLPACGFPPQLQKLELWGLKEWEEWIVEEGSMPLLHSLLIGWCPKLKKLPDGMRFIYSLKDLRIKGEEEEYWKERLSEGGEDYYKVKHIPSIRFGYEE